MKLHLSDKVVNGDLLRFYTPNGFVPIDPNDYDYTFKEDKNINSTHYNRTTIIRIKRAQKIILGSFFLITSTFTIRDDKPCFYFLIYLPFAQYIF